MATLAKLNVLVGSDISGLSKGIKQAQGKIGAFSSKLKDVAKIGAPIAGALVGIGAAAVGAAVKVGNMADELLDLEQMTGLTTDQLQEFRRIATVAGVGPDTIAEAAQRLTTRLRAAGTDTELFVDNMKALGVSSKDATGNLRPMSELLPEIIHAMQGTEDITKRNALAAQIFGRSYQTLAPILGLTTDQFEEARQSAHDLGLVIGRDSLNAANEFRVEWQTIRDVLGGAVARIGVELIPAMTKLANFVTQSVIPAVERFTDFLGLTNEKVRKFREEVRGLGEDERAARLDQLTAQFQDARIAANDAALAFAKFKESAVEGAGLSSLNPERFAALAKNAKETAKELDVVGQKLRALQQPAPPIIPPSLPEAVTETATAIREQLTPAQQALLDSATTVTPALAGMSEAFVAGTVLVRDAASVITDDVVPALTGLQTLALDVARGAGAALVDFAFGAKDALADFAISAIKNIASLIVQMFALKAVSAALGIPIEAVTGGSGGGGPISGILGAIGLQSGGAALAGRPYVVGEAGPELFVPDVSGTVVPNGGLTLRVDTSGLPPPPRAVSPDALAVDSWWRAAFSALVADGRERGVQFA